MQVSSSSIAAAARSHPGGAKARTGWARRESIHPLRALFEAFDLLAQQLQLDGSLAELFPSHRASRAFGRVWRDARPASRKLPAISGCDSERFRTFRIVANSRPEKLACWPTGDGWSGDRRSLAARGPGPRVTTL